MDHGAGVVSTVQWQRLYLLVLVSVASTQVQVSHRQPLSGHTTTSCTLYMPHSNPTSAESIESQDCKLIAPVLPKRCPCEPQLMQCWPL